MIERKGFTRIIMHCILAEDVPFHFISTITDMMSKNPGPVWHKIYDTVVPVSQARYRQNRKLMPGAGIFRPGIENLYEWCQLFRESENIDCDDAVVIFTGKTPLNGLSLNWDPAHGRNYIISTEGKQGAPIHERIFLVANDMVKASLIQGGLVKSHNGIQAGLTLTSIRKRMNVWNRNRKSVRSIPMEINIPDGTLKFPRLGEMIVNLSKYEMAVYLFFMGHPEGIDLRNLRLHISEIYSDYKTCQNWGSILPDIPIEEFSTMDFGLIIRTINEKIRFVTGDGLAGYYIIRPCPGGDNIIAVDRELLTVIGDF
jgi:hypothetical protein